MSFTASKLLHKSALRSNPLQIGRQSRVDRMRVRAQPAKDLLIVGPGVLGSYLGKLWLDEYPEANVTGQTNTDSSHERLSKLGLTPVTKATLDPSKKFSYVVFSAPPSGSEDYVGDLKLALQKWDGTGNFVFTSSSATVQKLEGATADENTPSVELGVQPRIDKLLLAEQAVLEGQGCVLRLVGLYHRLRGAHTFFLKLGTVDRDPNYVVNLIHYEDAARIAKSVLEGQGSEDGLYRSRVFIGSDNSPLTFQEMMDVCYSSGVFPTKVEFTGPASDRNTYTPIRNDISRAQLQWQPIYPSFTDFLNNGAEDYYFKSGLF